MNPMRGVWRREATTQRPILGVAPRPRAGLRSHERQASGLSCGFLFEPVLPPASPTRRATRSQSDASVRNIIDAPGSTRLGFTLIEVLIVAVITVVLVSATQSALRSSQGAFAENTAVATADALLRRVADRLRSELYYVRLEELNLTNAQSLSFTTVTGWDGESTVAGPLRTISFSSGQVLMNGNVIADGLQSLTFELNGDLLTVTIDIDKDFTVGGTTRTVNRRLVTLHRF